MLISQVDKIGVELHRLNASALVLTNSQFIGFTNEAKTASIPLYTHSVYLGGMNGISFPVEMNGFLTLSPGSEVHVIELADFRRFQFDPLSVSAVALTMSPYYVNTFFQVRTDTDSALPNGKTGPLPGGRYLLVGLMKIQSLPYGNDVPYYWKLEVTATTYNEANAIMYAKQSAASVLPTSPEKYTSFGFTLSPGQF